MTVIVTETVGMQVDVENTQRGMDKVINNKTSLNTLI